MSRPGRLVRPSLFTICSPVRPTGWSSTPRNVRDAHDERTLRTALSPHPSASRLVYEHVDSTSEPLLWIADIVAWCFGAGREWRKRVDPIVSTVVDVNP